MAYYITLPFAAVLYHRCQQQMTPLPRTAAAAGKICHQTFHTEIIASCGHSRQMDSAVPGYQLPPPSIPLKHHAVLHIIRAQTHSLTDMIHGIYIIPKVSILATADR